MSKKQEIAIFAAGCFWGVEEIFRKIPGVIETTVGYIGGKTEHPKYKEVCTGNTGHAEALEIMFDPDKVSYEKLLRIFFKMHDPTTMNRQHNDIGTQYRSAIFADSDQQKEIAARIITELNEKKEFTKPIVTKIENPAIFYSAEEEHQDYLMKNPGGYMCHILRD